MYTLTQQTYIHTHTYNFLKNPGVVVHVFNHSTEETGTDLCEFQSQSDLHVEF